MRSRRRKALAVLLVTLLTALQLLAAGPGTARAADHPYTTPGERWYNGRLWRTTCEPYSSTVRRCRAEIFATQIRLVAGRYVQATGFVFNNLTYLPSNGRDWNGNPLARDGQFVGTDGRLWRTECY